MSSTPTTLGHSLEQLDGMAFLLSQIGAAVHEPCLPFWCVSPSWSVAGLGCWHSKPPLIVGI